MVTKNPEALLGVDESSDGAGTMISDIEAEHGSNNEGEELYSDVDESIPYEHSKLNESSQI